MRSGRQGRAIMPDTVHPEILVVVDNAFYNTKDWSVYQVQKYIMTYINAVNMRFASVRFVTCCPE